GELLTGAGAPPATVLAQPGQPVVRVRRQANRSMIEVEDARGKVVCAEPACAGRVSALSWRPGSGELAFTTQDGHARQTLHLWDLPGGAVRTVASTEGLISGSRSPVRPCAVTQKAAVCVAASAVSPPRLERIDLMSGERTVLLDPNPTLRQRETPRVEQLTWTLPDGREATGTLLLPREVPDRAPLFVSYYTCPGYLRAATGDEYPLMPLVEAGIVVGCLNRVPGEADDAIADYRTGLASVEAFVERLVARGLVDPDRVGMGGFSFGSEVTM